MRLILLSLLVVDARTAAKLYRQTATEMQTLLAALTGFAIAARYGALEEGVAIDSDDLASRIGWCVVYERRHGQHSWINSIAPSDCQMNHQSRIDRL